MPGSFFTTWGPVRGCCGHTHLTPQIAEACIKKDSAACKKHGGYSDRGVRICAKKSDLRGYDVRLGPGRQRALAYED